MIEQKAYGKWEREMIRPQTGYLGLLLFGLLLTLACSGGDASSPEESNQSGMGGTVPVTVATAVQKDVPVQISVIGNVEAYSTVEIKPQVDGKLARAYFEEGDYVKKGEPLFLIDPRPFEAALKQAEANLARAIAQMNDAEADTRRYKELFEKGIVSEQQYQQNLTNFEALKATVEADRAVVENAELELEYCNINSPVDGRMGRLMIDPGNVVEANTTTLAVINQVKPIYVNFSVPEQRLLEIRKYMTAAGKLRVEAVVPAERDNAVSGELTFLNNEVDTATGTILLKAIFPNEYELLWPGKFVNVTLTLTTQNDAVVIPSQAIQRGQEGEYVFVVKPDLTVESRPVLVSGRFEQEVVIERGLQGGERVVTSGQLRLGPGVKVEIKDDTENSAQKSAMNTGHFQ